MTKEDKIQVLTELTLGVLHVLAKPLHNDDEQIVTLINAVVKKGFKSIDEVGREIAERLYTQYIDPPPIVPLDLEQYSGQYSGQSPESKLTIVTPEEETYEKE